MAGLSDLRFGEAFLWSCSACLRSTLLLMLFLDDVIYLRPALAKLRLRLADFRPSLVMLLLNSLLNLRPGLMMLLLDGLVDFRPGLARAATARVTRHRTKWT